jgi:poly(3-hydroxyalkanoate) depolymerase
MSPLAGEPTTSSPAGGSRRLRAVGAPASPFGDDTSFVHIGPIRVRVRVVGHGPPLLMIMGIGGNLDMWEPLVARLPDRQLVMFDFPGTGGSSTSWLPPSMALNAAFTGVLLRKLGYGRVDVLGYSWGGILAQQLAIQHPHRVRRLILAATSVGLGGRPPGLKVTARMLTPRRYYSRAYFTRIAPSIYGGRYRRDQGLVDAEVGRRIGRPPSPLGYASQLTAVMTYSSLPGLPFISAPTLVLAGADDPMISTFNPRLMAKLLRHATLRVIPDAGHLLLVDSPEIAAPLIEDFLAGD